MFPVRSESGFSLVEALVALAVFAMAGVGLVQLQTHSVRTLAGVEARALGEALAQNTLVRIVASNERPAIGLREEDVHFAGRDWRVSITIAGTADPATNRISVFTRDAAASAPVAQKHAFIAAPTEGAL